jgi:hypothetical protein
MATLLHEIWHEPSELSHTGWLPSCCLAGPDGEDHRRSLAPGARLVDTFEAGSHFDAMTIYHGLMGETYTTSHAWDHEPYPEEWAARQRRYDTRT